MLQFVNYIQNVISITVATITVVLSNKVITLNLVILQ